ncbi:hypothetical protein [Methylobacterium sp. NEAU K]|uniref:hypothetical protein n=1 Tax=Methylobacterium sp. NEAU K TaxID=3064946 RepID=UPI002734D341|nr:hypothetical protein [Methylobacterium sp. NEAU K]MDP4003962.1 hypothetical protein [Methylobacterium sp. NEAU K]
MVRRVAGTPDRLARGLAVLAVLVVAAAALAALPRPAPAAALDGPGCPVAGLAVAFLSDAQASAPEAGRSSFDRTDICAADIEILTDLGLPRAPVEGPQPRHAAAASYGYASVVAPTSEPGGSLHRPPRAA